MKFSVHRTFTGYRLRDESGRTAVTIRRRRLFSPAADILDRAGQLVCTVDMTSSGPEAPRRYLLSRAGGTPQTAVVRFHAPALVFALPRADEVVLETPPLLLCRARDRVDIHSGGSVIGSIRAKWLECSQPLEPALLGALYVFSRYMEGESEIIAV